MINNTNYSGHSDNVYAHNIENQPKHISEVESGRKGYFCMGCGREMQAKKSIKITEYFSHDPKNIKNTGKCTYSDETYRHKLAKEILQRIKKIKVPTLYKYPPKGTDGMAMKIKDAHFVDADTVKNELQFYEDESGIIHYGRGINFITETDKNSLIQPDVTFFDSSDNPILLIELVATHKISDEKLLKIRRLGIDVVQVIIPKESPEAIEKIFSNTSKTEWIYNHEQEKTIYIRVPDGNEEGISSTSEFQRKLSESAESYKCRAAQIKNLIRAINKNLGTEQFRNTERTLRDEIFRVKNNTEREERELRELRREIEERIEDEFRVRRTESETKYRNLEERYHSKRSILELELKRLGGGEETFEERIRRIRIKRVEISRNIEQAESNHIDFEIKGEGAIGRIERETNELQNEYRENEKYIQKEFDRDRREIEEEFESRERNLRSEFEDLRRDSTEAVANRDSEGAIGLRGRIKRIFYARELSPNITKGKNDIRTLERIKELFDKGTLKNEI